MLWGGPACLSDLLIGSWWRVEEDKISIIDKSILVIRNSLVYEAIVCNANHILLELYSCSSSLISPNFLTTNHYYHHQSSSSNDTSTISSQPMDTDDHHSSAYDPPPNDTTSTTSSALQSGSPTPPSSHSTPPNLQSTTLSADTTTNPNATMPTILIPLLISLQTPIPNISTTTNL